MSHIKGKKRDRADENQDPCKRERLMKLGESKTGSLGQDERMKFEEVTAITGKDGGISGPSVVEQVLELMCKEEKDSLRDWSETVSKRIILSTMIVATEDEECLSRFLQLGGLSVLDEWLQDAHNANPGDQDSEKTVDNLILVLLKALGKLSVDLDSSKGCSVEKSVSSLQSHKNSEIQRKARKLVDTWKNCVDAEMKSAASDSNHGSDPFSAILSSGESLDAKRQKIERGDEKHCTAIESSARDIITGDVDSNHVILNVLKDASPPISSSTSKESSFNHDLCRGAALIDPSMIEAKNSCSLQSPSQSCTSLSIEGVAYQKDDGKDAASRGNHCTNNTACAHSLGKNSSLAPSTGIQTDLSGGNETSSAMDRTENSEVTGMETDENLQIESVPNPKVIVRLPIPVRTPVQNVNSHGEVAQDPSPSHVDTTNVDSKSVFACSGSTPTSQDKKTSNCNSNDVNISETCSEDKVKVQSVIVDDGECTSFEQIINRQIGIQICDEPSPSADILEKGIHAKIEIDGINISRRVDLLAGIAASEVSGKEPNVLKEEYYTPKTSTTEDVNYSVELDGKANINMGTLSRDSEGVLMSPFCTKKRVEADGVLEYSPFKDINACLDKREASGNQDWHNSECTASLCMEKDIETVDGNDEALDEIITNGSKSSTGKLSALHVTSEGSTGDFEVEDALDIARQVAKEIEQELDSRPKSPTQDSPSPEVSNINITKVMGPKVDVIINEKTREFESTAPLENESIHQEEATATPKKNDYPVDRDENTLVGMVTAHVQATQEQVASQENALASVNDDENNNAAMARPVFDLNEGIDSDDCNGEPLVSTIHVVNVHSVTDHLACPPASSSAVTAPIAVIAVATGFVPPSDLLMTKTDLGWKGSAATSAFRPTEPCRANEPPVGTAVKSETNNVKYDRNFTIDLNVADERVMEDTCVTTFKTQDGSSLISSTVRKLELDLNRTEGTHELMLPPVKSACHNILDFDLNDGPGVDDCTREDSCQLVQDQGNSRSSIALAMRDSTSLKPWHTVENLHSVDAIRAYSIPAPRKRNTDYHAMPSSSNNNNNLPLASGLYDRTSKLYPTGPAQSEGGGSIPPITYGQVMGVIEVSSNYTDLSRSRLSLDLNIGPDAAEFDAPSMY